MVSTPCVDLTPWPLQALLFINTEAPLKRLHKHPGAALLVRCGTHIHTHQPTPLLLAYRGNGTITTRKKCSANHESLPARQGAASILLLHTPADIDQLLSKGNLPSLTEATVNPTDLPRNMQRRTVSPVSNPTHTVAVLYDGPGGRLPYTRGTGDVMAPDVVAIATLYGAAEPSAIVAGEAGEALGLDTTSLQAALALAVQKWQAVPTDVAPMTPTADGERVSDMEHAAVGQQHDAQQGGGDDASPEASGGGMNRGAAQRVTSAALGDLGESAGETAAVCAEQTASMDMEEEIGNQIEQQEADATPPTAFAAASLVPHARTCDGCIFSPLSLVLSS